MDSTAAGAYYASLLAYLSVIGEIDLAQSLGLSPTLFDKDCTPHQTNLYQELFQPLHVGVLSIYDEAIEIDRTLSLKVLESSPVSITQAPGSITQAEKDSRITTVNALATRPLSTIQALMFNARKLQSLFADKISRIARHKLMASLPPEDVIHTHSAYDEGPAPLQVQPTSLNLCLYIYTLEFKVSP